MTVQKTAADLVAALRSGEFVKGTGSLRKRNGFGEPWGYCCEGVMCEISELPVVDERNSEHMNSGKVYTRFSALPEIGSDLNQYPPSVDAFAPAFIWEGTGIQTGGDGTVAMIYLPIYERVPEYTDENDWDSVTYTLEFVAWNTVTLASLNDYEPSSYDKKVRERNTFTFSQIADLIEWAVVRDYGNK